MQNPSASLLSRFVMEAAIALLTGLIGGIVCYGSLEFGIGWTAGLQHAQGLR